MIISIVAVKTFEKIQHPFMIKMLSKVGIEGAYFNIYKKTTANIIFNGQKLKAFPLRSGTRQVCPLSTTLIQHSTGNSSHNDQTRKRNKRHPNQKEGSKIVVFADDMIVCIENPSFHQKIIQPNK